MKRKSNVIQSIAHNLLNAQRLTTPRKNETRLEDALLEIVKKEEDKRSGSRFLKTLAAIAQHRKTGRATAASSRPIRQNVHCCDVHGRDFEMLIANNTSGVMPYDGEWQKTCAALNPQF